MKLETNNGHKKAFLNLSELAEKYRRVIASGMVSIVLLSGCGKVNDDDYARSVPESTSYTQVIPNDDRTDTLNGNDTVSVENDVAEAITADTVVKIPENFQTLIASQVGKNFDSDITVGDLEKLERLFFSLSSNDDLSWLNYCKNLHEIVVNIGSKDVSFSQIKSLPSLEKISIVTSNTIEIEIGESKFGFLRNCPNLRELNLSSIGVEPGFVESLTQLKELSLSIPRDIPMCIDFSKLTHLDKIVFPDDATYEIPIYFTENDYNTLVNAGVSFTSSSGTLDMNQVLEIGRQLDQIVASLELTDQSTDQEKLDAILVYVLENYSYDPDVADLSPSDEEYRSTLNGFYLGGDLYGVFNKGGNIVCGNYSALIEALALRVGLDAHSLISRTHVWNIVNIEGENYVVDATWLDGESINVPGEPDENGVMHFSEIPASEVIKNDNGESLNWYMEKPSDVPAIDRDNSHTPITVPPHVNLESKEEEDKLEEGAKLNVTPIETPSPEKEPNESKKFSIKVGLKEYIIGGGALVGIASGLGLAIHMKNKRRRQAMFDFDSFSDIPPAENDNFGGPNSYGDSWNSVGNDSPYGSTGTSPFDKKTSSGNTRWPYSTDDSFGSNGFHR